MLERDRVVFNSFNGRFSDNPRAIYEELTRRVGGAAGTHVWMAKSPPLEDVHAPVLVIRAAESDVLPDVLLDAIMDGLPSAGATTVPGGHIVFWEAFAETGDAVRRFLEDSGS